MNNAVVALITGIIGLAVLSVVLSNNANTTNVVSNLFSGISSVISAATSPV
jgi:hypothetical protein